MPEVAFVCSPRQSWFMQELGETIRYELELQGIPSSAHRDGFPEPLPHRLYAVMAPREFVALEGLDSLPDDAILKRTVFISADPPGEELQDETVDLMRRAGVVFDVDVRSVLKLHRQGVSARVLRPGYSALRDRFDPDAERPVDVTFLGTASPRRLRLLSRYASVLARYNCRLSLADPGDLIRESSSFLAASKYDLLAGTKVVINLHSDDHPYLEWLRMLEAMHSGAVFVSEHSSGLAPFVPGEHLLVAGEESLPYVLEAVLHDEELARRLRTQAYERLSSWLPFALSIGVLRAALVELVGNPVPAGASLGRRLSARAGSVDRRSAPVPARDPEARVPEQVLEQELVEARAELAEVRRHVRDLQELVLARDGEPRFRLAGETPAWAVDRSPRVSVVVTPVGDVPTLRSALGTFARAGGSEYELIVVEATAAEQSVASMQAWMQAHPHVPARLITQALDSGLGAARNAGVAHALAPMCLIVSPGDALFPRCSDVLLEALEEASEDVGFAYPLVQAGMSLVNIHGWEPLRLRAGNDIRSPYLIRTEHLQTLDGYTEEPGSHGLEDHELWRRVAQRGWRGELVRQILARHVPGARSGAPAPAAPSAITLSGDASGSPSPEAWSASTVMAARSESTSA